MEPLYIVVMLAFIVLELISMKLGGYLLPLVFGIVGLGLAAASLGISSDIPLFPFPNIMLMLVSVIVMFKAGSDLRGV